MKHQLSLEVPDTYNPKIFRIIDTSKYVPQMNITCGYLQITGPGFKNPVIIETQPNFSLTLTACSLALQQVQCGEEQYTIPDGLYNIKYSVSPNELVVVEYNYLRVTNIYNTYFQELGSLEIHGCSVEQCIKDRLSDLREIKSYIDVAKAKVEYFNDVSTGIEIFKFAHKKLKAYSKGCC